MILSQIRVHFFLMGMAGHNWKDFGKLFLSVVGHNYFICEILCFFDYFVRILKTLKKALVLTLRVWP